MTLICDLWLCQTVALISREGLSQLAMCCDCAIPVHAHIGGGIPCDFCYIIPAIRGQ